MKEKVCQHIMETFSITRLTATERLAVLDEVRRRLEWASREQDKEDSMNYKEIFDLAEKRMDELQGLEPSAALEADAISVMEVVMDAMDAEGLLSKTITTEDQRRALQKIRDGAGRLMETALHQTNSFHVNMGVYVFGVIRRAEIKYRNTYKKPAP